MPAAPPLPDPARAARVAELLEGVDWNDVTRRVTLFAFMRTQRRSMELARDLAQDAIAQLLDPEYQDWDPAREPDLSAHLCNVVRGLASNRRRTGSAQEMPRDPARIAARASGETRAERSGSDDFRRGPPDAAPVARRVAVEGAAESPEAQAERREIARARVERLRARSADDPRVLEIIARSAKGMTRSQQAEAMRILPSEVDNAHKRIFRVLAEVERELHNDEETDDGRS